MKKPFVTLEKLKEIEKTYSTPYHIYDEKGIRENARNLKKAFAWNKGFKQYFAVKATPNPTIMRILAEEGWRHGLFVIYGAAGFQRKLESRVRKLLFPPTQTPV